jgi:hypothetical protein
LRTRLPSGKSTPLIPGLRTERDDLYVARRAQLPAADSHRLRRDDDTFALGRLVGDRSERGKRRQLELRVEAHRFEVGGVAIAHGDRARFVKQYGIDIPSRLNRLAALRDDVGLERAIHACDSDCGEQRSDRGRNQTDQQRDQGRDVRAEAFHGL